MKIKEFFFKNTGIKQTIVKNTFWLTSAEIVARFFSLFLVIYVARILGANEYGKFSFALFFASLVSMLSDLGIAEISTREFSRNKENEKKINSIFTLNLFLTVVALIVAIISSFFITADPYVRKMILILTIFVLGSNVFSIFFSFLRARQKMEHEAIIKILQSFVNFVVVSFILFYFPTGVAISFGYLFSTIIVLFCFLLYFGTYFKPINLEFHKDIFATLKISWPLSIGFVPAWIYIAINSIMLGYFSLITENGWYSAASRVAIAAMILSNLVVRSFYPALSNLFFMSKEKTQKAWNYLAESIVSLIIPIVIGGVVLAPKIIYSFYGADFNPSVLVLRLLIFVVGISFINYPYTIIMVIADYQKQHFILIAVGAIINIILNLILIPIYSFYGVVLATIIASLFVLIATILLSKKNKITVSFNNEFLKTIIIASFSGFVMYAIISYKVIYGFNIFIICAIGGLAYIIIFFSLYKLLYKISLLKLLK